MAARLPSRAVATLAMRSPLLPALAAAVALVGCVAAAGPRASNADGTGGADPSGTLTPGAAPTADGFWSLAADAARAATPLRIRATGPTPGELRYEAERSATILGEALAFVCHDGRARDGQSGFAELPGSWSCGVEALVRGFRLMGQPLDAWSAELPPDAAIVERVGLEPDGTWRWDYAATNPFVGGSVAAVVILDPATGRIARATRTDPTGPTTWAIDYEADVPAIDPP